MASGLVEIYESETLAREIRDLLAESRTPDYLVTWKAEQAASNYIEKYFIHGDWMTPGMKKWDLIIKKLNLLFSLESQKILRNLLYRFICLDWRIEVLSKSKNGVLYLFDLQLMTFHLLPPADENVRWKSEGAGSPLLSVKISWPCLKFIASRITAEDDANTWRFGIGTGVHIYGNTGSPFSHSTDVTSTGKILIKEVGEFMEKKYDGRITYGDTDSFFVS